VTDRRPRAGQGPTVGDIVDDIDHLSDLFDVPWWL
jgi:hypothetical protein